jgi:hypothetical protein
MHSLDALRDQFEAGDRGALLAAIRECARCDIPLPAWAAVAYIEAYERVLNLDVNEVAWDAVFGKPYLTGTHLGALRKTRKLRPIVWSTVQRILDAEPATIVDNKLFERVGKMMRPPIGHSDAAELYYEAVRMLGTATRQDIR